MLTVDKEMNVEVIFTVINLYEVTYMIFIYLQSFIYHFMGLFGTNIRNSSQLLAQLVEHCTSIAEVMGSNPIKT